MYSEMLVTTGLTQKSLELFVLLGICVSVIGFILVTYWRYILFGAFAIFCLVVMANGSTNTEQVAKSQPVIQQEKPKVELDEDTKAFLEDCKAYTDYDDEQCMSVWTNRTSMKAKSEKSRILRAKYQLL